MFRFKGVAAGFILLLLPPLALAREFVVPSPNNKIKVTVSDENGITYRVTVDDKPVIETSHLGFTLLDGTKIGDQGKIIGEEKKNRRFTWEDSFGTERLVLDNSGERRIIFVQEGKNYQVIVRAYDNGVAFRYSIRQQPGLENLAIKEENTEFAFASDYPAWTGNPSVCAENTYPERTISKTPDKSVLPALVQTPTCLVSIAESDLMDWAGMFLKAGSKQSLKVDLAGRKDGKGVVSIATPAQSPWRVIMIARTAADLLDNNLVKTLATPSQVADTSWIKPGITAWDAWWANTVSTRGTTETHKPYIDLASRMGWPYMICDWGWYEGSDVTKPNNTVDIPGLIQYAAARKVKLILWLHSDDLNKTGVEKAFSTIASWGVAGVKVDFMNNDSQEMIQWYVSTLATAAKHKLLVDFHGAYKPTGLARTFPNYITQEGVLGNEWNKLDGKQCTVEHTMILPFTRALLGPMDFTPGGFNNVLPQDYVQDAGKLPGGNCQVMGSRAHQLALSMIYPSPLLVLCDSPTSYLGKDLQHPEPGLEFYRGLPTVWDETKVLQADVGKVVVIARRSGTSWWIAAMSGDDPESITLDLSFLGPKTYVAQMFYDSPKTAADPKIILERKADMQRGQEVLISLAPGGGGFVAKLTPKP